MVHFIDANENVTVMPEGRKPRKKGLFKIPSTSRGFCANVIEKVGLYAYCEAFQTQTRIVSSTQAAAIYKRLNEMGYNVQDDFYMPNLETKYKWYCFLNLCTLYGGDNRYIKINKPFVVPKEYIQEITAKYEHSKVEAFTKSLVESGHISFIK